MIPEDLAHQVIRNPDQPPVREGIVARELEWPEAAGLHVRTLPRSAALTWQGFAENPGGRSGFFHHHAASGGDARDANVLLWRLMSYIRRWLRLADPVPIDPQAMREVLPNWLARASAQGGLTVLIESAHELSRDGLTADLDWLPAWLPADVSVVLSTLPGPAAEQFRERADSLKAWGSLPTDARGAEADAALASVSDWLDHPTAEALLPWCWLSRAGLTSDRIQSLLVDADVDPKEFEPQLVSSDGLWVLHPASRDAVARRFLADHGRRQQLHEHLAQVFEIDADAEGLLEAAWHWRQAGRRDRVAACLCDERVLSRVGDDNDAAFESVRSWAGLVDSTAAREAIQAAAKSPERSPAALLGCARLYGDLLGESAPLAWLERALTCAADNARLSVRATLRLSEHPDSDAVAARQLLDRALAEPPRDELERARLFHARACLAEADGQLESAIKDYQQALSSAEGAFSEDKVRLLPWISNLSATLKAAGDFRQADGHARRALSLARDHLGASHPALASACDLVAGLAYMSGQYDMAEPLYREALRITEAAFGPDHSATAACLGNLGSLLDARQQFREAEQCQRRALAVVVAVYGEDHSESAGAMHNLAVTLESLGKSDEAERLYRRALDVWNNVAGEQSPAFATTLLALACVLRDRSAWQESEALLRADIEIWRGLLGPDHPHTLGALTELARLYVDGGKPELAEPLLLHLCDRLAEVSGRASTAWLEAVTLLAGLQHQAGRNDEARALLHSALAASQSTLNMLSAPIQKARRLLDQVEGKSPSKPH